jgi:hypothetical protein
VMTITARGFTLFYRCPVDGQQRLA